MNKLSTIKLWKILILILIAGLVSHYISDIIPGGIRDQIPGTNILKK